MDLKGAEIRNLKDLCMPIGSRESKPLKVTIPYYQRPYKWDEQRIKNLFSDFFKSEEKEYFVGSVVMVDNSHGNYDIIDGQQRTTTLFLLNFLRFVLLRAYIEELIIVKKTTKIDRLMTDLEKTAKNLFDQEKIEKLQKLHERIVNYLDDITEETDSDEREKLYSITLQTYEQGVGLPAKNFSDMDSYRDKYITDFDKYLSDVELALEYSRGSYNEKLLCALGRCMIKLTSTMNPEIYIYADESDPVVIQYASAIRYEFEALRENVPYKGNEPLEYALSLIKAIDGMLDNIKSCVIITGNEKDAYTLFEVLNDRSMPIEDLDLIKNLFYKWYCQHTDDSEKQVDKCIEKADYMWVEDIFSSATGKEQAKMISFLAAEYFTADEALKFNDTARYRESIERYYLIKREKYNGVDLLNDVKIYNMVSIILREMEFKYQKKAEKVLSAESEGIKSITYRSLNLLHALKLYGVLPAVVNIIIKKFIEKSFSSGEKELNISKFEEYVKAIRDDSKHANEEYKDVHRVAYDFWRYALLTKNSEIPRTIAKKYIEKNNAFASDYEYKLTTYDLQMRRELEDWTYAWKYEASADSMLKAKVLFINLFETSKSGSKLELLATRTKFATYEIQLDHMEARKPNEAAREKYFSPTNPNEQRLAYVDGIGNFMIMDREENNWKNNLPLQDALKFYDDMAPGHWMIKEVRDLLEDDEYSCVIDIAGKDYRVPKDEFFQERRARLCKYFTAILHRDLNENTVNY